MPGPQSPSLFFCKCACTSGSVFPAVSHFDVHGDVSLVGDFGVSLNNEKVFLIFARSGVGEVTAFELSFVELVEEGERDVFVLFVFEVPVDPLSVFDLEVLKDAQVDVHNVEKQ